MHEVDNVPLDERVGGIENLVGKRDVLFGFVMSQCPQRVSSVNSNLEIIIASSQRATNCF